MATIKSVREQAKTIRDDLKITSDSELGHYIEAFRTAHNNGDAYVLMDSTAYPTPVVERAIRARLYDQHHRTTKVAESLREKLLEQFFEIIREKPAELTDLPESQVPIEAIKSAGTQVFPEESPKGTDLKKLLKARQDYITQTVKLRQLQRTLSSQARQTLISQLKDTIPAENVALIFDANKPIIDKLLWFELTSSPHTSPGTIVAKVLASAGNKNLGIGFLNNRRVAAQIPKDTARTKEAINQATKAVQDQTTKQVDTTFKTNPNKNSAIEQAKTDFSLIKLTAGNTSKIIQTIKAAGDPKSVTYEVANTISPTGVGRQPDIEIAKRIVNLSQAIGSSNHAINDPAELFEIMKAAANTKQHADLEPTIDLLSQSSRSNIQNSLLATSQRAPIVVSEKLTEKNIVATISPISETATQPDLSSIATLADYAYQKDLSPTEFVDDVVTQIAASPHLAPATQPQLDAVANYASYWTEATHQPFDSHFSFTQIPSPTPQQIEVGTIEGAQIEYTYVTGQNMPTGTQNTVLVDAGIHPSGINRILRPARIVDFLTRRGFLKGVGPEQLASLRNITGFLESPTGFVSNWAKSTIGTQLRTWGTQGLTAVRQGLATAGRGIVSGGRALLSAGSSLLSSAGAALTSTVAIGGISAPAWLVALIIVIIIVFVLFIFKSDNVMRTAQVTPAGFGGQDFEFDQFITLTKTATPQKLAQPVGDITYTYSIEARSVDLTNISITDETIIYQESGTRTLNQVSAPSPPSTIKGGEDWTSPQYTLALDSSMNDASIINTITVTADAIDTPIEVQVTAAVIIGNPPFCAPTESPIDDPFQSGWGYGSSRSHCRSPSGHQGVDLGGSYTVKSPFLCESEVVYAGSSSNGFGSYVALRSLDGIYYTFHAHLESGLMVSTGQVIPPRAVLGTMDNTGNSSGDHLHYEIRDAQKGSISPSAGCQPSVTINPCSITNLGGVTCSP